jgi:imidazolonepropionase-like amidohydrolase
MESSENKFIINGVTLVDVENGLVVPGQTVLVAGDRIERIGARGELEIPERAQVVSGDGLYLMPGLVDAHVHYFDAPVFNCLMIANGVLLVRDTGMPNEYILNLRDQLNLGETLGPELVTTGSMLDGIPPLIPSIAMGVETPEAGRVAVRAQAGAGVDMIKAYSRLDREVFLAIVDEAHKNGLKVVAHLPESVYLEDAAVAGLDSNEHFNGFEKIIASLLGEPVNLTFRGQAADAGYFMRLHEVDPEKLRAVYQRIHASSMILCPTVVTFKTLTDIQPLMNGSFLHREYISPGVMDLWKSLWAGQSDLPDFIWKNWVQMVADMNAAGIPLMIGTDLMLPGILPGFSVHEEMAIWQEAGIPAADILRSATIVPTEFMGFGDRLGSIREGKSASMLLVRGNPLEDVRNAQKIEAVFLRGQYFNRTDLDRLLDGARGLAKGPIPRINA